MGEEAEQAVQKKNRLVQTRGRAGRRKSLRRAGKVQGLKVAENEPFLLLLGQQFSDGERAGKGLGKKKDAVWKKEDPVLEKVSESR